MKIKNLFFVVFWALFLNAQAQNYTFSFSTGSYADLIGSTSLNNDTTWDDPEFLVPIGFDFVLFGDTIDHIIIKEYGFGGFLSPDTSNSGVIPLLIPYGIDIVDRGSDTINYEGSPGSASAISYVVDGNVGNRIFKLEWNNAGFYDDLADDNIASDYINFQLWFFEGSNEIEMHFGPNSVLQPAISYEGNSGTSICLFPDFDMDNDLLVTDGYVLEGDPAAPVMKQMSVMDSLTYLNGTIPNGMIYNFSPLASGVKIFEQEKTKVCVYPNPNEGLFFLETLELDGPVFVCITDVSGRVVEDKVYHDSQELLKIDISVCEAGIYFLSVSNMDYRQSVQIVVN